VEQSLPNIEAIDKPAYGYLKQHQLIMVPKGDKLCLCHTANTPIWAAADVCRFYRERFASTPIDSNQLSKAEIEETLKLAFSTHTSETINNVDAIEEEMDLSQLAQAIPETEDLLAQEDEAPIIRLINAILTEAVNVNASDIHIETYERRLVIRFRIDGTLRTIIEPKRSLAPLLVSRIKIMAKLDIAEKRVPQDGRISVRISSKEIDIRASTLPSNGSERVVLRILDKQAGKISLEYLGMHSTTKSAYSSLLQRPHGIILVTGPTGSGKTTSLYSGLSHINSQERNILTVEDPIEYQLDGVGQTQVNSKTDMTFARGLRAILRQDPDVVMIGEIRDKETASIAIQASLTGHLVLSTLHTNTAIGAITRLQDMGIEPFLIASSTIGIMAQRLIRKLCPNCKQSKAADTYECDLMGVSSEHAPTIYSPQGCPECNHRGYMGRTGIYELISVDNVLRNLIHHGASEQDMLACARNSSASIRKDGILRVTDGTTSLDEVLRITHID